MFKRQPLRIEIYICLFRFEFKILIKLHILQIFIFVGWGKWLQRQNK